MCALLPSEIDCPKSIRRIALEKIENPKQKGAFSYNIQSFVSFLKNAGAIRRKVRHRDVLSKRIKENMPDILKTLLINSFKIQLGRKFLRSKTPKCVVVSYEGSSPIVCSAIIEGIPVFMIQHGLVDSLCVPFLSDLIYVWGDTSLQLYQNYGASSSSLFNGGALTFEHLKKKTQIPSLDAGINKIFELKKKGLHVFVLWSQGEMLKREGIFSDGYKEAVSWFLEAKNRLSSRFCFVIKLHHTEPDAKYYRLVWTKEELEGIIFCGSKTKINELLNICDATATYSSGACYDTVLKGVPLIQLHSTDMDFFDLGDYGIVQVSSKDELCSALDDVVKPEKREKILKSQEKLLEAAFANRGREAEVIAADIVRRVLGTG